MSRIALIDLTFHWPPTAGSYVDLKEMACRTVLAGHEVKLFVPHFDKYFPRGVISQPLPIEMEILEFDEATFNFETLPGKFRERIEIYKPDVIFVNDGTYLKPFVINILARDFRVITRICGHEPLCLRNTMYLMFDLKRGIWNPFYRGPCGNHLLKDPDRCYRCFFAGWKIPFLKLLVGSGLRLKAFHYPHAYLAAKAYRKEYVETVRDCFEHLSDIITYNDFMADLVRPFNQNVHVVPPGVDVNHFNVPEAKNNNDVKRILMAGRASDPMKGFELLAAAAKILHRRRQDFKVIATFPSPNKRRFPSYIENVGWWSQKDLPNLYATADIVVAPALWQEPFGIIPLEAMSCRRPVVASRVGGHMVSIVDEETGLLFASGDSNDLAAKISILLDSYSLRRQMGEKGRKRVLRKFTWDVIMQEHYSEMFRY